MVRNPDISGLLLVVQAPIDKDIYSVLLLWMNCTFDYK